MSRIPGSFAGTFAFFASILVSVSCAGPLLAEEKPHPGFRPHAIAADSTYSAAAAIDVNHDGRLDVISGGWWYEAPGWKRHFVREVEVIRGRYDDYSNLPLDVDGDGWTDLVSANYRSQSLYWVRHPGPSLGVWERIVIDTPGPMETGRLVDVDGDGRLDVLPNGTNFAAWWELTPPGKPRQEGKSKPAWIRHDLPQEVAGHGLGLGDIDGDGRNDLVSPRGWLAAPENRRTGRWLWHAEFELHRDGSIPILVYDADGDGDNDIVWGRGHATGLYWLEQTKTEDEQRRWTQHAIDTSWSQPHSLLLADVDGDGRDELVAGKRYMGHDGKDLGEYDPLVIAWYKFDPDTRAWRRGVISCDWRIGFDLDPKASDLDGDGDLDLVAGGRSGLYWLENLLVDKRTAATIDKPVAPRDPSAYVPYPDHTQLMVYRDEAGQAQPVKNETDWAHRRAHILAGLQQAMGELPDSSRRIPLDVQTVSEENTGRYLRRKITFAAELRPDGKADRVPAWVLIPMDTKPGQRLPAMLCLHQTTKIGNDEPTGLGGRPTLHYAHELAERGFVCIVPDYPSFGEYPYDFKTAGAGYASGTMKAIWNNVRAIDVLETLPQVDRDRIGCIGHSLGGHNSLFTAPFDLRIKAVVTSCGFTGFHDYYGGKLAGWTSDRYMPRIRDVYENNPDRMPFDFHEVLAAIAPRGIFVCAPERDSNFDVGGVRKVIAETGQVYKLLEAKDRLRVEYPDSAHDFPDETRRKAYEWLEAQLRGK